MPSRADVQLSGLAAQLVKTKGSLAYNAMARKKIPVVEVTAPDGTKSFWGAYSIPYDRAVAAVRAILPAKYTVELSLRRLPPGYRFVGARRQISGPERGPIFAHVR
jgi:hypothetical protein